MSVNGAIVGRVGRGLLILLGVGTGDSAAEVERLAEKIVSLRIFPDDDQRFNRSLLDVDGGALVISQFTLYADTRRGRRPSFSQAAAPDIAAPLVEAFAVALRARRVPTATGVFGARMQVALINDGPVTITLDSSVWSESRRIHSL